MCRVCGGQGENCNTVEGVLDDKVRLKNPKFTLWSWSHGVLNISIGSSHNTEEAFWAKAVNRTSFLQRSMIIDQ